MKAPYERPTNELRQVRHTFVLDSSERIDEFIVQRMWVVQNGPMRESDNPERYTRKDVEYGLVHMSITGRWCWLKPVWRDLPIIDAKNIT